MTRLKVTKLCKKFALENDYKIYLIYILIIHIYQHLDILNPPHDINRIIYISNIITHIAITIIFLFLHHICRLIDVAFDFMSVDIITIDSVLLYIWSSESPRSASLSRFSFIISSVYYKFYPKFVSLSFFVSL